MVEVEKALLVIQGYWFDNPVLFSLVIVFAIVVATFLGVAVGNVTSMRLISSIAGLTYSGKPIKDMKFIKAKNKDVIGWLSIPSTVYMPIMDQVKGFYRYNDMFKWKSKHGSLYKVNQTEHLKSISINSDDVFPDLTVIRGSMSSEYNDIKRNRFSLLKKYVNSDLKEYSPDIILVDNNKLRKFYFLFATEIGIEDREIFKFKDRESFISNCRAKAYEDSGRPHTGKVIILQGSNEVDSLMVFLVEQE